MRNCYITQGAQPGALWRLRGVELGEGREAQDGGDICNIMAELHCFMAEPTQHCKAIFLQLKNKLKNNNKRTTELQESHLWKQWVMGVDGLFHILTGFLGHGPLYLLSYLRLTSFDDSSKSWFLYPLSTWNRGGKSKSLARLRLGGPLPRVVFLGGAIHKRLSSRHVKLWIPLLIKLSSSESWEPYYLPFTSCCWSLNMV